MDDDGDGAGIGQILTPIGFKRDDAVFVKCVKRTKTKA